MEMKMKNQKTEDEEKEPLWFNILMWTIIIVGIIGIFFLINHFTPKEVPPKERCSNECNKFDMKFHKIDYNTGITYICWCLDSEGKPRSVGAV